MKIAIYPGSFDPVTNGHIDILEKSSKIFDKIIVAVVHSINKKALFSLDERVELIKESSKHLDNIEVECFNGLLVDYLNAKDACAIIRGLRTVTDFEYEMHMAMMNKRLLPEVDTIFIIADSNNIFLSSSGVKEAALLGGNVSTMVPQAVESRLKSKQKERDANRELS